MAPEKVAVALFEHEHEVRIGNDVFSVRPFGMRQLTNKVMQPLRVIMAVYESAEQFKAEGNKPASDLEMFMLCGDAAYEILAIALNRPVEYFDEAELVDTLKAFAQVVELNTPFFVKALESELPRAIERIKTALAQIKAQASHKA